MFERLKKKLNPYPRPLGDEEKRLRIDPNISLRAGPRDYCKVVRVNSTFLEIVGAEYNQRGSDIGVGVAVVPFLCAFILGPLYFIPGILLDGREGFSTRLASSSVMFLLAAGCAFALRAIVRDIRHSMGKFVFYPIRFNRRNGKVYRLRKDGGAAVSNWDDLHFAFARHSFHTGVFRVTLWGVGAYSLDESGETAVDGFQLPVFSENEPILPASFWEFVRTYMKEGPETLVSGITRYLPLDPAMDTFPLAIYSAKPPWGGGVHFEEHSQPSLLGRWLINTVCRRPEWPPEVERECRCDAGDPFARDASGQERFTAATLAETELADQVFYKERLDYIRARRRLGELYGGKAFGE